MTRTRWGLLFFVFASCPFISPHAWSQVTVISEEKPVQDPSVKDSAEKSAAGATGKGPGLDTTQKEKPADPSPTQKTPTAGEQQTGSVGGNAVDKFQEIQLKIMGEDCDINKIESVLLRQNGVVGVDIEKKKDHALVRYDPLKTKPLEISDSVARSGKVGSCFTQYIQ